MVPEEPLKEEAPPPIPPTVWTAGPPDAGPYPEAALLSHCSKTACPSLPLPQGQDGGGEQRILYTLNGTQKDGEWRRAPVTEMTPRSQ